MKNWKYLIIYLEKNEELIIKNKLYYLKDKESGQEYFKPIYHS